MAEQVTAAITDDDGVAPSIERRADELAARPATLSGMPYIFQEPSPVPLTVAVLPLAASVQAAARAVS